MQDLGILVLGHRRPDALWNVLESLRRQNALELTHVWIDGLAHSSEMGGKVNEVRALGSQFMTAGWVNCNGRLGIEKLMLDALTVMARTHDRIIVLEDDCFPTTDAVQEFRLALDAMRDDALVYSVYGSPFGVDGEGTAFSRFQGWGWATWRHKLLPVLAQLKSMFMMDEPAYLRWAAESLTPDICRCLDLTLQRNVVRVLQMQFSWDSATALLTALLGQSHRMTAKRVVYNCGAGDDAGHFRAGVDAYREPPFNMIGRDEVWQYFSAVLAPNYRGRKYFGLDDLDRKLESFLGNAPGTFVELGAFDGLNQTNTLALERRGWRGVLIEAVGDYAAACTLNRPLAKVVHAACVGRHHAGTEVEIDVVGLMSLVDGTRGAGQDDWISRGEAIQHIQRARCRAPARTLDSILQQVGMRQVDLLSLDVEGYEEAVLDGLDFSRWSPGWILAEDSRAGSLEATICAKGYDVAALLNERQFTRDILFRRRPAAPQAEQGSGSTEG